jgi:hypothetical protein
MVRLKQEKHYTTISPQTLDCRAAGFTLQDVSMIINSLWPEGKRLKFEAAIRDVFTLQQVVGSYSPKCAWRWQLPN